MISQKTTKGSIYDCLIERSPRMPQLTRYIPGTPSSELSKGDLTPSDIRILTISSLAFGLKGTLEKQLGTSPGRVILEFFDESALTFADASRQVEIMNSETLRLGIEAGSPLEGSTCSYISLDELKALDISFAGNALLLQEIERGVLAPGREVGEYYLMITLPEDLAHGP